MPKQATSMIPPRGAHRIGDSMAVFRGEGSQPLKLPTRIWTQCAGMSRGGTPRARMRRVGTRCIGTPRGRMRPIGTRCLYVLFLLLGTALPLPSLGQTSADPGTEASLASTPPGPTLAGVDAIDQLIQVQSFVLRTPYEYRWSAESLTVEDGLVLVLQVDPLFSRQLQTGSQVLYVGPRPAEIVNGENDAGIVIAIAPGEVDLSRTPIFYGSTVLPERVSAARGREELAAATALGVTPIRSPELTAAIAAGGAILEEKNVDSLYRGLAELLARYSPQETDLIGALRLIP